MCEKSYWLRQFEGVSREECIDALQQNGLVIKYLSEVSEELCLIALNTTPKSIKYITLRTPVILTALANKILVMKTHEFNTFASSLHEANLLDDQMKHILDIILPTKLSTANRLPLSESVKEYIAGKWPDTLSWFSKPTRTMIKAAQDSFPRDVNNLDEETKLRISENHPYMVSKLDLADSSIRTILRQDCQPDYHITEYCNRRLKYFDHLDADFVTEAIVRCPFYFKDLAQFQTPETCLLAVQEYYYNIRFVLPENQTEEICWTALKTDAHCIDLIVKPTYGMIAYFLSKHLCLYDHFRPLLTKKEWDMFYEKDPSYIHYFPENLRTPELCNHALDYNGYAIKYIINPDKIQQERAIRCDPCAIQYIINPSRDLCHLAVGLDGRSLAYIPEKTDDLCKIAVTNDGIAIKYVPKQTLSLCLLAASQTPKAFEWIEFKYLKDCYEAVDGITQRIIMNEEYYFGIQMSNKLITKCRRLTAKKETIHRESGLLQVSSHQI